MVKQLAREKYMRSCHRTNSTSFTNYCANCASGHKSGADTSDVEHSEWLIFGEQRSDFSCPARVGLLSEGDKAQLASDALWCLEYR